MKTEKTLFICTKPYQYMIINLIIKAFNLRNNSIIVLNHFNDAFYFSEKLKKTKKWENVYYIDDHEINEKHKSLNLFQIYKVYKNWQKIFPELTNFNDFSQLFIAHDSVAIEYAFMRFFDRMNKKVFLYEEGAGNYVNINSHKNFITKILKKYAYIFNIPGEFLGQSKFINKIYLQFPEIAKKNVKPLSNKIKEIPLKLADLLKDNSFVQHMNFLFNISNEIKLPSKDKKIDLFLGSPIINNGNHLKLLKEYFQENMNNNDLLYIKQHPGEKYAYNIKLHMKEYHIPQNWPIELLSLKLLENNVQYLNIYSFCSTSLINFYSLLKDEIQINFYIFNINDLNDSDRVPFYRFLHLYDDFNLKYDIIDLKSSKI